MALHAVPGNSSSGSGVSTYANYAALPGSATDGTLAITLDTHTLYVYNSGTASWQVVSGSALDLVSYTQYGGF